MIAVTLKALAAILVAWVLVSACAAVIGPWALLVVAAGIALGVLRYAA